MHGGPDPLWYKGQFCGGEGRPSVKYSEYPPRPRVAAMWLSVKLYFDHFFLVKLAKLFFLRLVFAARAIALQALY